LYIVGFIDNSFDMFDDYQTRLFRHGIQLLAAQEHMSKDGIVQWILSNNIKCVMVDYKLRPNFDFVGTDLVAYINSELPDLPCMVLTAYPQESLSENLVVKNMIEERDVLDATDISAFVEKLKQAVHVFDNRLARHVSEYSELFGKKTVNTITSLEEERFLYLFRLLRAYGEIDEIPSIMMQPEISGKIDALIDKLDNVLDRKTQKEDE